MDSPDFQVSEESPSTLGRLRQVAMELFASAGYSGTSMADIARRVGVRKASLYNYYRGKEELLLDLLRRALATWTESSLPALEALGSREQRLRAHLEATVDFVAEHPHEAAIVRLAATQIGGDLGERVRGLLTEQDRGYTQRLERFFAAAVSDGEIHPAEPRELTLYWKVFVDGLLINQMLRPADSEPYRKRLPRLWTYFWRGLAGPQDPSGTGAT